MIDYGFYVNTYLGSAIPEKAFSGVATQARDAALLCEKGYRIDKVQPVDMFCWTSGVECVAAFTRID